MLRRISSGAFEPPAPPPRLVGHLHTARCAVAADTSYRPQDLRAVPTAAAGCSGAGTGTGKGNSNGALAQDAPAGGCGVGEWQVPGSSGGLGAGCSQQQLQQRRQHDGGGVDWDLLLRVGSMVAAEARAALRSEAGYRSSAGAVEAWD